MILPYLMNIYPDTLVTSYRLTSSMLTGAPSPAPSLGLVSRFTCCCLARDHPSPGAT